MKKLLLFPFNGNSKEAASVVEAINANAPKWELLGFIDDAPDKKGSSFGIYSVLGDRFLLAKFPEAFVLACPGRPENFNLRPSIVQSLLIQPNKFATIVHPSVIMGIGCSIGNNSLIMANVVLTANVTIKSNVIILPNTVISHDSTIGEWTIVGSNVSVSGCVSIGTNCYIGTGTKIINNIKIANNSMVGLGSVVIRDIKAFNIVAGNPAKDLYEN